MSRQRKNAGLGEGPITRVRGGTRDRLRDAGSKELAQLAKKVGNGQIGAMLGSAREKRDALLRFIQRRLAQVRAVQVAEQREMTDRREWWMRVARGKSGFHLPDPTRWHAVAHLYKRAADAVCAGDLGRSAHILDDAVRTERAAFEAVPDQVELPSTTTAPAEHAEERPFIEEGEACPPTQSPDITKLAGEIIRVSESMDLMGMARNNPVHHWWDAPEEEPDDGKKKPETRPAGEQSSAPARAEQAPELREEKKVEKKEEKAQAVAVSPAREQRPRRGKKEQT